MQRFRPNRDRILSLMEPSLGGEYVKYKDAAAEIERLREQVRVEKEENRWAYVDAALKDHSEEDQADGQ